jgi:hypothetical protein
VEDVDYDPIFFEEQLRKAEENYKTIFAPDYFENRIPRNLDAITIAL